MWRRAVPGSAAAAGVTAMLLLAGEALADVSTLFANNDSTLISNTPSANDNSKILTVWVDGSDRRNAILGFRLGSLAPDLTEIHILDVQLRLAGGAEGTALGVYSSASNQTATWSESTVTWNSFNQPAGAANGANLLATTSVEPLDEWATWSSPELTAHLQSFADAAHPGAEAQVTLIVRAVTNDDSKSLFQSGEGPAGPSLIITYNRRLDVSMTATVTERREIFWDIEKSVDRDRWDLFRGDSGTSRYTIKVGKFELLQAPTVSGGIRVTNPASNAGYPAANITSITASLCNQALPVTCPGGASQTLDPGAALDCTYGPIQVISGCIYAATATTTGVVAGGTGVATPVFEPPVVSGRQTVRVDDTDDRGDMGPISTSTQYSYDRAFTCDADRGTQSNTARIVETGRSDSVSVSVDCRALQASKDVTSEFTRSWSWEIDKTADQDTLELAEGEPFEVAYAVTLDATNDDSEHRVSGNIVITNNTPIAASLNGVSDQVGGTDASVSCPGGSAQTLAAGATVTCAYQADASTSVTQNTATVTLNNFAYNGAGQATPAGTTDFTATVPVSFDTPTTEVDRCVDVSDSLDTGGVLPAEACAPDASFDYLRFVGPFATCGEQQASNTAAFLGGDTGAARESTHVVSLNVVGCDTGGCTLGQGYWKTHSEHGPAPYDANWANLGSGGADTAFFDSGQSYYEVMWTPPRGGNTYYILAHPYIGATLNQLNGADIGDVQTAYDAATELFGSYTPQQVGRLKGNNAVRKAFIAYAGIIGDYNEGSTGPGQCDEDRTVAR